MNTTQRLILEMISYDSPKRSYITLDELYCSFGTTIPFRKLQLQLQHMINRYLIVEVSLLNSKTYYYATWTGEQLMKSTEQ